MGCKLKQELREYLFQGWKVCKISHPKKLYILPNDIGLSLIVYDYG